MIRTRFWLHLLRGIALLALAVPAAPASAGPCFGGKPAPGCSGFVVLEATYGPAVFSKAAAPFVVWYEAGYLHNVDRSNALGLSLKVTGDEASSRYGPVVRYRRWLGRSWSIDAGAGAYLGGDKYSTLRFPSPTLQLGAGYKDFVGVQVGADLPPPAEGTTPNFYLGVRFGRWLAPASVAAVMGLSALTWE